MILFLKHVEIEGPETLGTFFVEKGYKIKVIDLHHGDQLPVDVNGLAAVISLGGHMNVYEEETYPFLKDEDAFLKKVLKQRVPMLGICLGSQLLSKAAGGRVVLSPGSEIGWFTIDITPEGKKDRLFTALGSSVEVFQWHGDMCEPPAGAEILASSVRCPVQAFRYGANAYGLQFHAEITDKSIQDWSADFSPERVPERQKMLTHYSKVKAEFHQNGQTLCDNFWKVIRAK